VTTPTPESYWVTPDVLAGKYPGAKLDGDAVAKVRALLDAGVKTFVDLTEDDELLPYAHLLPDDVTHIRVAVPDVTCPSVHQVRDALQVLHGSRDGGIVYVHCRGGCGRTGVIVGCYLVESGLPPDEALARVHELTRVLWSKPCPETPEQMELVLNWRGRRADPPPQSPRTSE
jgi:protein-tyrosine phosphatase